MVKGGYFGDVRVASNTASGHTWAYFSPDESGAPSIAVGGDGTGRLDGSRTWRTVMSALQIPDDLVAQFPDVAGAQPLSFMLA